MSAASDSSGTLATYSYDPLSRRTALAYGNGAGMAYGYSDAGDLLTLNHDLSGTANDVHFSFAYTPAHELRLETASIAAYAWYPSATASGSYTPNALNQYSAVDSTSYTYDGNGNLTSDGTFTYAYDAENRLLTASRSGLTAAYSYDPLGRRTHKSGAYSGGALWGSANWGSFNWASAPSGTYFVSSGSDEIAEYDASGTLATRTVPGPAIDEPIAVVTASGTHSYFHTNRLGSVIAMSGAGAALIEGPYTYSPYGACYQGAAPCSSAGEPYRYTGRRLDAETGLYYYRARYYSAPLDRFYQTDPVGYCAIP
jgi:RHS repeat-associated protein